MSSLSEKVISLAGRVEQNNRWRQAESFNLIPSETTPSLLVKLCEISDPAGRYAEHRTMKGEDVYFYQGTDFIRDVEIETSMADSEQSVILQQVTNGIAVRMAVLYLLKGEIHETLD